jgi:glycosyltransferase involved in cell wall biosynthesis
VLLVVEASFAGVGRHVLDLAEGLAARGEIVDIVYGAERAEPMFVSRLAGLVVRNVSTLPAGRAVAAADVWAVARLGRFVRRHGPFDIVHGHASKGGAYVRLLRRGAHAVVYTPNALVTQSPDGSALARHTYATIERVLSRRTDGLIHVSPEEAAHAAALRLSPRQSFVVPNGLSLVELPPRDEARRRLGLPLEAEVIGYVGRLGPQKSVETLVRAFALLRTTRPTALLAIIGDGDDGQALRRLAAQLGVGRSVVWLGTRPGQEAMPAFDVLALPSRYEGFPYAVLEALWAGVPVVASTACSTSLVLTDRRCGVAVPRTPEAFAAALLDSLDERGSATSATDVRRAVAAAFSVDTMVDATRRVYDAVSSREGQRRRCG